MLHSHVPSPVMPSLHWPFLHLHSAQTQTQSVTGRTLSSCYLLEWMRGTYPDHSGLHICQSGMFHKQYRRNLCYTDTLRFHSSRPNTVRYQNRPDQQARDTAHSAPQRILHNTSAPWDRVNFDYLCLCSVFWKNMWRTIISWRQVDLQPMVSRRSPSNIWLNMHFLFFTDFCTHEEVRWAKV